MTEKMIGAVRLETACGAVRGNEREDCLEFLGVPYARAERFAYASAVEHSGLPAEPRLARAYGKPDLSLL